MNVQTDRLQQRQARMPAATTAFTLIELLVTVSIIAILAALLLPVLARAKDKARATQCLGNLLQWGLAMRLYADDNGDFLPRRGQGVQTLALITRPDDWFNALPIYFSLPSYQELAAAGKKPEPGDHSVFICPDAVDPGATNFMAYGMNMNLSHPGTCLRPSNLVMWSSLHSSWPWPMHRVRMLPPIPQPSHTA